MSKQSEDDGDDLGSLSLGFRILFVVCFAWLAIAYQLVNPGVREPYPWEEFFLIGLAPVLIIFALYGIRSVLRQK